MKETVAVLDTPSGLGGVAVLQIVGPAARRIAIGAGVKLDPAPAYSRLDDDVLACFWDERASPWKLPTVEISCHGGTAAPRALLARLGVPLMPAERLYADAVRRRAMDRTRAEARLHLTQALTVRAAGMLLAQAEGALARAVARMRTPADAERLLATAAIGRKLVEPPRVVLAGPPNAGKSTLFNALARQDRAFVSDTPGTTRDPVEETVAMNGFPVRLVDTAGLAEAPEGLERVAVQRSREALASAALTVWVRDARVPGLPASGVRAANKTDVPEARAARGEIPISARTGAGLDRLRRAIARALGLRAVRGPVVFTARQETLLRRAASGARVEEMREKILWT
ncbi:MAG: 50S ribosome-binding GTPase [Planctomycetes bacterium]|nr:50S ribosome-binding GTPase [Planctomycetota bacterium]